MIFRVVQVIHGGERLARADASVVGRDHAVQQHAESGGAQQPGAERCEQAVLEHAPGQRAGVQPGFLADGFAGLRDHTGERRMEPGSEHAGVRAVKLIAYDVLHE